MNILHELKQQFLSLVTTHHGLPAATKLDAVTFALTTDAHKQQFGDLSCNVALILAPLTGTPARAVAEKIIAHCEESLCTTLTTGTHRVINRIEIAGPGFSNIFLTPEALWALAVELWTQGARYFQKPASEKTINYLVEFVSGNPTGPLHIGHGRNGIIGDTLARILRARGHQVTTEFYINDAGSQIKKLGLSLKVRIMQLFGHTLELPEGGYQGEYVIELAQKYIDDTGMTAEKCEHQPMSAFEQYAYKHLLAAIEQTLTSYGITFDVWFSEQQLHASGAIEGALERLQNVGALYEQEGALWFKSTEHGDDKDRVVRKNTGELTYVAADIAYLLNKIDRGFDQQIMVLGQDHHGYVDRLKAVLKAFGYNSDQLHVILYQLVTLKTEGEQVRMSKRKGQIVSLADVIETVGPDVARFFYLNRKADAHLDFNIDLALQKTEENPVFYLQYAYVRTGSILDKATAMPEFATIEQRENTHDANLFGSPEHLLIKKIAALDELLATINRNLQTHMIAYYTLELAHTFHSYYAAHRVINTEDVPTSCSRLRMIQLVRTTLGTCFDLLGISKPHRM